MKILFLLMFSSCASYVSSIHNQIDRDEAMKNGTAHRSDPYSIYREQGFKRTRQDRRPIMNPLTQQQAMSQRPEANGDILPSVKRDYRPANQRASAQDFIDSDNSGSLWASPQTSTSLYGSENVKHTGDIVIIDVLDNLRTQISTELKRAFATEDTKPKAASAAATPEATAGGGAKPPAGDKAGESDLETKVYDKISGIIAEEISKDYILVRGKKEVIFKKEKRYIEVQALVPRREVGDNDTVSSDKILESRVIVLR